MLMMLVFKQDAEWSLDITKWNLNLFPPLKVFDVY